MAINYGKGKNDLDYDLLLYAISAGNKFLSLLFTPCRVATGCGSIHGGNPALSALKYFGPNIRDTEHKEYLSPFPYDVL